MPGRRVGLPRMHKEAGERRDFLPRLVEFLHRIGAEEIVLEHEYGQGMGVAPEAYLAGSARARFGSYQECLQQDVVVVVRCPSDDALRSLPSGSVLVSMLHFPTRPGRVRLLSELGIRAISLDSVKDDLGQRLVQNMHAVGWNGVKSAFQQLALTMPQFHQPQRGPIRVTVLGSGAVGGHAVQAAIRYGDVALRQRLFEAGLRGVQVTVVDYELTADEAYMLELLGRTDLLIDATQRPDPTRLVIPNPWLAALPTHAVLLDLAVDPYDFSVQPPELKGIEGIPEGNLDQFVFPPGDPAYAALPPGVRSEHRRVALSCYSWPGVDPRACMEVYSAQIEPVLRTILTVGAESLDACSSSSYERATARAELEHWRKTYCH